MTQLHLDLDVRLPVNPAWAFGGHISHAALLLREDVRRHLRVCHDELGFRHVRCRGILSDGMGVLREDGSFDFTKVEQALDALMENGLMPFIDLSDVPVALAREGQSAGPYGLYSGPPRDWGRWSDLIKAFAGMIDGRYGCDAREWHFEVGHDADNTSGTGTRADYLKLYDLSAKAIKEVHPEFRVGGRATLGGGGLDDILRHVTSASEDYKLDLPRCDFVRVHVDPNASRSPNLPGEAPPAEGTSRPFDLVPKLLAEARRKVTDTLGEAAPLICSGWDSSAAPPAFGIDECNNAALVAGTMVELSDVVQGAIYGNLSDIDDADGFHYEPFHGGPGLLTVNEVRKAAFNAFRLLGEHRGYHAQRIGTTWTDPVPGLGCFATVEEYTLRLLCWYHRGPQAPSGGPARFTVEGLSESIRMAQVEVIRPGAGSPYEKWVDMGRPQFLNLQWLHDLEVASQPGLAEVDFRQYPPRLEPGMVMQLTIPLPYEETWTD